MGLVVVPHECFVRWKLLEAFVDGAFKLAKGRSMLFLNLIFLFLDALIPLRLFVDNEAFSFEQRVLEHVKFLLRSRMSQKLFEVLLQVVVVAPGHLHLDSC